MKRTKELCLLALSIGCYLLLILYSADVKKGVLAALELCVNMLIPSLFPFLVLSNFVALSGVSCAIAKLFGFVTEHVFHLPRVTTSILLLSMIAGYPTGAIMISRLLEQGEIDTAQGKRLMKFCFNSGLPFAVTAVGVVLLGDKRLGLFLYLSTTISALLLALADGASHPCPERQTSACVPFMSYTDALLLGVKKGINAMVTMCAFVLLFGAFNGMLAEQRELQRSILPLLEITMGITNNIENFSLPILAFFMGFGGLCIHFQISTTLKQTHLSYLSFFTYRVLQGVLSLLICALLLWLFPSEVEVFSNLTQSTRQFVSISVPSTVMMLLMSFVLVMDVTGKKKHC